MQHFGVKIVFLCALKPEISDILCGHVTPQSVGHALGKVGHCAGRQEPISEILQI